MAGARQPIDIEINDTAIRNALKALRAATGDLKPAFRDVGEALLNSTRKRFTTSTAPDGQAWKPLSAVTLHLRALGHGKVINKGKNKGRYDKKAALAVAFAKPLVDFGRLVGTLNYQVSATQLLVGTPQPYGATHQFGAKKGQYGTNRRGGPIPWGNVPARPFLGLSVGDQQTAVEILGDHLNRALGAP